MKNFIIKIMLMATIFNFFGCSGKNDPSKWNESKTNDWFSKGDWKNGWAVTPDESINKKEMAIAYFKNKERWNSAFDFLKSNDLTSIEAKRHDIDGNNLYVLVSEYNTKNEQDANYEAHRKYIDIQYVVKGKEIINITPLSLKDKTVQEYDETKDIEYFTVKEGGNFNADPGRFFVFFPGDAHRPSIKVDTAAPVRKVVVKLKID
jgi:YhcH/YjgK/YiaL family protein